LQKTPVCRTIPSRNGARLQRWSGSPHASLAVVGCARPRGGGASGRRRLGKEKLRRAPVGAPSSLSGLPAQSARGRRRHRTSRGWMRPRRHLASRRMIGRSVSRRPGCRRPASSRHAEQPQVGRRSGAVEGGGRAGKPPPAAWIGRRVKRAPSSAWISPPRIWTFVVVVETSRVVLPQPPRAPPTASTCSTDGRRVLL
jgi:hypothetical protein